MNNQAIRNELFHFREQMMIKRQEEEEEETVSKSREIAIKTIELFKEWKPERNSESFNDVLNLCNSNLKKGIENARIYYGMSDTTTRSNFFMEVIRPIEDALELFIHNTE